MFSQILKELKEGNRKILLSHITIIFIVLFSTFISISPLFYDVTIFQLMTTALFLSSVLFFIIFVFYTLYMALKSKKSKIYFSALFFILLIVIILILYFILFITLFLWYMKVILLCSSVCLLVFSTLFSLWVTNLEKPDSKEFTTGVRNTFYFVVIWFIACSIYVFFAINVVTIEQKERLAEVAFDGTNLELFPIENAYHPFCTNNVTLSWYTVDCEDEKYLQSREIKSITPNKSDGIEIFIYEVHDDFRNFTIVESIKPATIRNNEIQSFAYSFLFILLNLFIGYSLLLLSPYRSHFKVKYETIKIIWKTQSTILLLFNSIMISEVFKF